MAERTEFHVWAGSHRLALSVNDLSVDETEARRLYRNAARRHPYAELVRREWNDAPLYVGRRWVSAGCKAGCCGWTLNTLESKGDAANYQDHRAPVTPGVTYGKPA